MNGKGLGVPHDHKTSVKWYKLAAEQGSAKAQTNLGTSYAIGMGVIQDNVYAQIAEAQKLARECVRKNYKGC